MENTESKVTEAQEVESKEQSVEPGRRKAISQLAYASPAIAALLLSKTAAAQASGGGRFAPPPPPI